MGLDEDIATALINAGYATALGTDLSLWDFQDLPENQIIIIPYGGREPTRFFTSGGINFPSFQVQVRNRSKTTARNLIAAIWELFDENISVPGCIIAHQAASHYVYLGKDEAKRSHIFAASFNVER